MSHNLLYIRCDGCQKIVDEIYHYKCTNQNEVHKYRLCYNCSQKSWTCNADGTAVIKDE